MLSFMSLYALTKYGAVALLGSRTLIRRFRNTMESGKLLYLQGDGPTICTDSGRRYGSLPGPIDSELTVAHDPARAVFSATAGNAGYL